MIDIDSMIVSLRLAWLKRIFNENGGTWKSYLCYLLERFGGLFINCNYAQKLSLEWSELILGYYTQTLKLEPPCTGQDNKQHHRKGLFSNFYMNVTLEDNIL